MMVDELNRREIPISERIVLRTGNIAALPVDAVVTATNPAMMGGAAGVDGAIHRAAGPELAELCRQMDASSEGEACITPGFALPARFVIHAVGPVYIDGAHDEAATLEETYRAALLLAEKNHVETIAFPCISTGAFRYPRRQACEIAVTTVKDWLSTHALPHQVTFCCFDPEDTEHYTAVLQRSPVPISETPTERSLSPISETPTER